MNVSVRQSFVERTVPNAESTLATHSPHFNEHSSVEHFVRYPLTLFTFRRSGNGVLAACCLLYTSLRPRSEKNFRDVVQQLQRGRLCFPCSLVADRIRIQA